jgi:amino acid transporter
VVGVLTGIISSCGAIERLSHDHILPSFFLRRLKYTDAPYLSILTFIIIGLAMFGVVGTNINILSGQFAISFICVMGLFCLSNIFLKFNRDRLQRIPRVGLGQCLFGLVIAVTTIVGNIVYSPEIAGYFVAFFVVTWGAMLYQSVRGRMATAVYWVWNRNRRLHEWRLTRNWHVQLIDKIKTSKKQPVVFFAKTDEVPLPSTNPSNLRSIS